MFREAVLIAAIAIVISQQGSAIKDSGHHSKDSQCRTAGKVQQQASFPSKKPGSLKQPDLSHHRVFPYRRLGLRRGTPRSRKPAQSFSHRVPRDTLLKSEALKFREARKTKFRSEIHWLENGQADADRNNSYVVFTNEDRQVDRDLTCSNGRTLDKRSSNIGRVLSFIDSSFSEDSPELTGSEPISEPKLPIAFIISEVRSDGYINNCQKLTKLDFYDEAALEQMDLAPGSDGLNNEETFNQPAEWTQSTIFENDNDENESLVKNLFILTEPAIGSFCLRANRIFDDFPYNGIFNTLENQEIHEEL